MDWQSDYFFLVNLERIFEDLTLAKFFFAWCAGCDRIYCSVDHLWDDGWKLLQKETQ